MEKEVKKPTSQDTIPALDAAAVFVSVCKRTAQDQPQHCMSQLSPQVCEHLSTRGNLIAFLVKFLDRVGELSAMDQKSVAELHRGR